MNLAESDAMNPFGFIHGAGDYNATIAIVPLPLEQVRQWLPPELEPAPQTVTPPATHPMLFLMGKERRVHANIAPWFNIRYGEFAAVLPYTQWRKPPRNDRGPYLFTPLLYLDSWLPIWAGRILYGFAKAKATITATPSQYVITDPETKHQLLKANLSPDGVRLNPSHVAILTTLLQQPSLSNRDGTYVYSQFNWNLPKAQLHSKAVELEVNQFFMYGLPSGVDRYHVAGVDDLQHGGAFHIQTHWTLSAPQPVGT